MSSIDLPARAQFARELAASGFCAHYVPARPDKVAINWQRTVRDRSKDTRMPPETPVYALVPDAGMLVVDMDVPKDGSATGWEVLHDELGNYGTSVWPATWWVLTPSGGAHLYYRLPKCLHGIVKTRAHAGGIPIDTRAEQGGYVIGPTSKTAAGTYSLVEDAPSGACPEVTPEMMLWLANHGYIAGHEPEPARPPAECARASSNGVPDMSPIPEGQRNDDLYRQAFGRLKHYPDNADQIRADLFERGRVSDLPDEELARIWHSVAQALGFAT